MESRDLASVLLRSLLIVLTCGGLLWFIWNPRVAYGFWFGGIASTINIWAIRGLVSEIHQSCRAGRLGFYLFIKLPMFYGIGALLIRYAPLSIGAGIVGFHIPFLVMVWEVGLIWRKDSRTTEM